MRERSRDDTTDAPDDARRRPPHESPRRSYYYDDATGYEVYNPDEEDGRGESEDEQPAAP